MNYELLIMNEMMNDELTLNVGKVYEDKN